MIRCTSSACTSVVMGFEGSCAVLRSLPRGSYVMTSRSGVTPWPSYSFFSSSAGLNVPSASFTAWPHGMFFAPGMCPPRCACSVGYSGGARISPVNSFGLRTSTRTLFFARYASFT